MAGARDTILFDRIDIRVGTQLAQVFGSELSGVTADEVVLMGDIASTGRDAALGRGEMGSKGHPSLEENDVPAGDGVGNASNSDGGVCHEEEMPWWLENFWMDPSRFYSAFLLFLHGTPATRSPSPPESHRRRPLKVPV